MWESGFDNLTSLVEESYNLPRNISDPKTEFEVFVDKSLEDFYNYEKFNSGDVTRESEMVVSDEDEERVLVKRLRMMDYSGDEICCVGINDEQLILSKDFFGLTFRDREYNQSKVRFYGDNVSLIEFSTSRRVSIHFTDKLFVLNTSDDAIHESEPFYRCFQIDLEVGVEEDLEKIYRFIRENLLEHLEPYENCTNITTVSSKKGKGGFRKRPFSVLFQIGRVGDSLGGPVFHRTQISEEIILQQERSISLEIKLPDELLMEDVSKKEDSKEREIGKQKKKKKKKKRKKKELIPEEEEPCIGIRSTQPDPSSPPASPSTIPPFSTEEDPGLPPCSALPPPHELIEKNKECKERLEHAFKKYGVSNLKHDPYLLEFVDSVVRYVQKLFDFLSSSTFDSMVYFNRERCSSSSSRSSNESDSSSSSSSSTISTSSSSTISTSSSSESISSSASSSSSSASSSTQHSEDDDEKARRRRPPPPPPSDEILLLGYYSLVDVCMEMVTVILNGKLLSPMEKIRNYFAQLDHVFDHPKFALSLENDDDINRIEWVRVLETIHRHTHNTRRSSSTLPSLSPGKAGVEEEQSDPSMMELDERILNHHRERRKPTHKKSVFHKSVNTEEIKMMLGLDEPVEPPATESSEDGFQQSLEEVDKSEVEVGLRSLEFIVLPDSQQQQQQQPTKTQKKKDGKKSEEDEEFYKKIDEDLEKLRKMNSNKKKKMMMKMKKKKLKMMKKSMSEGSILKMKKKKMSKKMMMKAKKKKRKKRKSINIDTGSFVLFQLSKPKGKKKKKKKKKKKMKKKSKEYWSKRNSQGELLPPQPTNHNNNNNNPVSRFLQQFVTSFIPKRE